MSRLGLAFALLCCLAPSLRAEEGFDPGVARRITPEEVQKRAAAGEKPIFLDTRRSMGDEVVPGAVHVTNDAVATWAKGARKDALIVTYCT